MQQLEDKTSLQTVIGILNESLEKVPKIDTKFSLEEYQNAKNSMEKDVFELPNYEQLFYDSEISNQDINELCNTLKALKNNKYIQITNEQKEEIKKSEIYNSLINLINNNIEKLTQGKDINDLVGQIGKQNFTLENSIIDKIYEVIRKYNISKEKTIVIFKNLMMHINNLSYVQNKTIEVKPILTEEQLTELFNKYGYDFNKVPKEFQLKLLSKGNSNTIEEMFNCMPNYGIKFSEKNKATLYLILKSSNNALEKMRELSQKYGFNFHDTLKNIPASFIHKSKNTDIKKNRNYQSEDEKELIGAFEDFCENIEIIDNLGYNIPIAMKKAISVFTKSSSKIKRNIELLREYNFFDGNNLASTGFVLSGLKSSNLQEMIDIFIELDELKYVRDNSSRLVLDTDSYIIRRLYFAKKNGINNYKRQKGDKTILTGIISDEADKSMDIYIDLNSIKHNVFDELTDREIADYLDRKLRETNDDVDTYQEISILDNNYTRDDYTYDFNGTIISNKKVKKIYPLLLKEYPELDRKKLLLYAITYNSMMSSEEFENISNIIIAKEKKI